MAKDLDFQVNSSLRPIRERVGLIVDGTNAAATVKTIVAAEAAGIWMVQSPFWPDALTLMYSYSTMLAVKIRDIPLNWNVFVTAGIPTVEYAIVRSIVLLKEESCLLLEIIP